jgi:hypothetical protein
MTRQGFTLFSLAAACVSVSACSQANPVIARDPLPPPPPGYRVVCESHPLVIGFISNCVPGQSPVIVRERAAVRARG